MKGFFSQKKKKILARTIVLGLCLGFFSHARAAAPSDFETEEYFKSNGLDIINASTAYSKGYTGQSVTVGISDEPVNFTLLEFNTKQNSYVADDFYPPCIDENGKEHNVTDSDYWQFMSHGTAVAGAAAASRNGVGMHGVAFDAEILNAPEFPYLTADGLFDLKGDWIEAFQKNPGIRVVNCSWAPSVYATELFEYFASYGYASSMPEYLSLFLETFQKVDFKFENLNAGYGLLQINGAGNDGYVMSTANSTSHWFEGKNAPRNVISVTGLEETKYLSREGDRIIGNNILGYLSNGAAFNEDGTLAAPSNQIVTANAEYVSDGSIDMTGSGTSVATPFVSGAAVLVQQAFPYMTAKQIGDVILSTANPNVTSVPGYTVLLQRGSILSEDKFLNILYFDGKPRTAEEQRADCLDYLNRFRPEYYATYAECPIYAYYNVPMEALIGQGVLDAGKAVDGPGALNARRLDKSDISSAYTVGGVKTPQALYAVDTAGYDSTWANDIKEVRVGLLAADSTEEDLKKRFNFYTENWLEREKHGYDGYIVGVGFVKAYIDFYNDNAQASGLADLPVGLVKSGEGRLSLTGNNTYQGASIARQGTLSIDGSVAGDAYSIEKGTIAGRGTINGTLYNNNIAVAGDATGSGNLTMDKLISRGVLLSQYQNGTNTQFIVKGEADINGSTVPVPLGATPMPDDKYTVVKAGSITGTTKDLAGTEYELTGMLSAKNEIEGGTLSVVVEAANNMDGADAQQNETFDAMVAMDNSLKASGDPRRSQMQPLFSLSPAAAKEVLSAISSNASAKSMAVAQRSMMTHHILSSRLNEAFMPKPVKVKLPAANLDNNKDDGLDVSLNLLEPAENDIWLKFGKNWGDLKDGADYHSSTTLLGYDKAVAPNWRVGAFAGYSSTGFSDNNASNELKDTRFGLYAGYNKAGKEAMAYLDYGWLRNKLHRGIPGMGLTANACYHSRILELGGEYLYVLHAAKNVPWHIRPYVNAQLSRLWQNGYSEEGAGVFNQVVQGKHNDYFGMGAGVEFKRYLKGGNYAIRAGVRHAFAGAEPKLRYSYMGDAANTYDMRNVQDKTHFVLSIGGEAEVAKGWSIGGDAGFTRGRHDKDFSCSVTVKRMW